MKENHLETLDIKNNSNNKLSGRINRTKEQIGKLKNQVEKHHKGLKRESIKKSLKDMEESSKNVKIYIIEVLEGDKSRLE